MKLKFSDKSCKKACKPIFCTCTFVRIIPLKTSGNFMHQLFKQSVTLHFVLRVSYDSQCKQGLFP
jgi:hypothetical protein